MKKTATFKAIIYAIILTPIIALLWICGTFYIVSLKPSTESVMIFIIAMYIIGWIFYIYFIKQNKLTQKNKSKN